MQKCAPPTGRCYAANSDAAAPPGTVRARLLMARGWALVLVPALALSGACSGAGSDNDRAGDDNTGAGGSGEPAAPEMPAPADPLSADRNAISACKTIDPGPYA